MQNNAKLNILLAFGGGLVLLAMPLISLNYHGFLQSYYYFGSALSHLCLVALFLFLVSSIGAYLAYRKGAVKPAERLALCFMALMAIPFIVWCDGSIVSDTVTRQPVPIENLSLGMHEDDGTAFITGKVNFHPEQGGEKEDFDSGYSVVNYDYAYINSPLIAEVEYAEAYSMPLIRYITTWKRSPYGYLLLLPEP